jgi:outer membrane protein assembly factor BamB
MKPSSTKTIKTLIALILTVSITASVVLLPTVNAHTPPWTIISYAYIVAAPNPIGVGQKVSVTLWIDTPIPSAAVGNDIRRHDYTLTITDPDGEIDTEKWDVVEDTGSTQFYQFIPTKVGEYTLKFDYAQQEYTWSGTYKGDIFTAASRTTTLTVQEEQIPDAIYSYPLPSEYWTRPIEGQNTNWYTISSNWLGSPYVPGANCAYGHPGAYQPDGPAPNSAHVMWSKPIQYGGVLGGNMSGVPGGIPGEMYFEGGSYAVRWTNPLIMYGTLFYEEPYGNSGTGGNYVAVDLRTGEEIWRINPSASGVSLVPSFGYNYALENPNQHGFIPNGILIASGGGGGFFFSGGGSTYWRGYNPATGELTQMNITNIPSGGVNLPGPHGEYLKIILTNKGTSSNPNWYLSQWNSSRVFGSGSFGATGWYTGSTPIDASVASAYDWNVSVNLAKGSWSIGSAGQGSFPFVDLDNMALLVQGTFGGHVGDYGATVTSDPANITAISLSEGSIGSVLWRHSYEQAPNNNTRFFSGWDVNAGVFAFCDKETFEHWGFSLENGNKVWGPSKVPADYTADYNYFNTETEIVAYGKIYYTGYSGILYCFDIADGKLLWTYGNGGEGNSTASGLETPWGNYPIFISDIADGKVFLCTTEHSPNSPLYKDAQYRAINATDGTEIWKLMQYANNMYGGPAAIASGYLVFYSGYTQELYCIGKGPSAMSVTAPDVASTKGSTVVIRGTVMDIAAGTNQAEQAARFPNGVPCVSDASQQEWMQYVYMQKPRPNSVTGVEVVVNVLDSNNNNREIGRTMTDINGFFALNWVPDIEGNFTVTASFAGSESYWPSHAVTSFAVDPAPTPAPTAEPVVMPDYTWTIIGTGIAMIIAVAIVGILILRKH